MTLHFFRFDKSKFTHESYGKTIDPTQFLNILYVTPFLNRFEPISTSNEIQ
jgi:hypothetical protein